jgi:hypothetical protein
VPLLKGNANPSIRHNGVSALLSLDDERLLVLERAYVASDNGVGNNTVRLFESIVTERGSTHDTPSKAPLLPKRLVLDFDEVIDQLEPGYQSLDNFEGMTLGPPFPSGDASLLLVSDNNFNDRQRTVFLAFRLVGVHQAVD